MKKIKKYLQIAISIVLLAVLVSWINIDQFLSSLQKTDYWYIGFAIVLMPVDRLLMAYKWNLLLKEKNIQIKLLEAFRIYYISNFLGVFLPPTIGTDIVRATYVAKQKFSIPDVIASILVERLLGFLSLFIFGIYSIIIIITTIDSLYISPLDILLISILATILFTLAFIFSFNSIISNIINYFIGLFKHKKYISKFSVKIQSLVNSYQSYKSRKITLILFFLLTLLEIFMAALVNYLIAVGLHADVSLIYFTAFIPLLMIVTRLPISLDGFGIKEGGSLYFLSLVGVPDALGFSIGLLSHILTLISVSPGGILYFIDQAKKKIVKEKIIEDEI